MRMVLVRLSPALKHCCAVNALRTSSSSQGLSVVDRHTRRGAEGVLGASSEWDDNFAVLDLDGCAGVDDLSEEGSSARVVHSVSEPLGEDAIEGAGHECDLEVEMNPEGRGGGHPGPRNFLL